MVPVKKAASMTKDFVREAEREAFVKVSMPKTQRTLRIAMIVAMIASVLMSVFAFAAPTGGTGGTAGAADSIEGGIKSAAKQVYDILKAIVLPLGAVVIAIVFLWILFDGERGMEKGKKYLLRAIIVVAVVYVAPVIISQIGNWFSGTGDAGIFGS